MEILNNIEMNAVYGGDKADRQAKRAIRKNNRNRKKMTKIVKKAIKEDQSNR